MRKNYCYCDLCQAEIAGAQPNEMSVSVLAGSYRTSVAVLKIEACNDCWEKSFGHKAKDLFALRIKEAEDKAEAQRQAQVEYSKTAIAVIDDYIENLVVDIMQSRGVVTNG